MAPSIHPIIDLTRPTPGRGQGLGVDCHTISFIPYLLPWVNAVVVVSVPCFICLSCV